MQALSLSLDLYNHTVKETNNAEIFNYPNFSNEKTETLETLGTCTGPSKQELTQALFLPMKVTAYRTFKKCCNVHSFHSIFSEILSHSKFPLSLMLILHIILLSICGNL